MDALNEFFADIVKKEDAIGDYDADSAVTSDGPSGFEFQQLNVQQTQRLLESIKVNTATGHDGIPGFLLKKLAPAIAPNLSTIFNESLSQCSFPKMWKLANICPVWKNKGSRSDPANFRPISVLPVLARLFEKETASQLYQHCSNVNAIPNEQFGFRKKSSCEMAILSALDSWRTSLDAGKMVGVLIDLTRAFDSVPHESLLLELTDVGCGKNALQWFGSYIAG